MKRDLLLTFLGGIIGTLLVWRRAPPCSTLAVVPLSAEQIPSVEQPVSMKAWPRFKRWQLRTRIAAKRFVKFGLIAALTMIGVQAISPEGLAGLLEWENIAVVVGSATIAALLKFMQEPGEPPMAVPTLTLSGSTKKGAVTPPIAEGLE